MDGTKPVSLNPNRSRIMRSVKGYRNRSTELRFRGLLARKGLVGWRVRPRNVFGRPDFVFERERVAIFLDGCFWHGCPICRKPLPVHNADYWANKINRNKLRDAEVDKILERSGWKSIRFWEHEVSKETEGCVDRLARVLSEVGRVS